MGAGRARLAAWLLAATLLAGGTRLRAEDVTPVGTLWLSLQASASVGGIIADRNDIVACKPVSGQPSCEWSLVFDGSDVGLRVGIASFDALASGQLLMVLNSEQQLPGLADPTSSRDIVLFTPTNLGDTTTGHWSAFLDGDRFPSRQWDGIALDSDGSLLLSAPRGGGGPPLFGVRDEDIIRCRPSATDPSGVIINCTYEGYFDASLLNIGVGVNLQDFDLAGDRSIVFVSAGRLGLPPNEPGEDLIRYDGPVPPPGPGGLSIYLYGALAGLDGISIGGVSFAPGTDLDSDGVPDVVDNCPNVTNPDQADADADAQGDACDGCPHIVGARPDAFTVSKLDIAFPGGAGGLNDQVKKLKAFVSLEDPFDLTGNDELHVMIRHALGPEGIVFEGGTRAGDGNWRQLIGRPSSFVLRPLQVAGGGFRRATLKSIGGGARHKLSLQSVPMSLHDLPVVPGRQLRATLEISTRAFTGACYERLLRCKGKGRRQTCR
jgi:hypothetical protein